MKLIVIDNYDSFTYNLVHYLEELGCEAIVKRNDKFKLDELDEFSRILLSTFTYAYIHIRVLAGYLSYIYKSQLNSLAIRMPSSAC